MNNVLVSELSKMVDHYTGWSHKVIEITGKYGFEIDLKR